MLKINTLIAAVILTATIPGCRQASHTEGAASHTDELQVIMDDYQEAYLRFWPLSATSQGDHRFDDQLSNYISFSFESEMKSSNDRLLQRLAGIDRNALSEDDKISCDLLAWKLEVSNESIALEDELMPVNQIFSRHLTMAQMAGGKSSHPFKTAKDYDNWLSRLEHFLEWTDTAMSNMRRGIESGHVLPKALIEKMIPQLDDFVTLPAEDHLFFYVAKNFPEGMSPEDKNRLQSAYREMVEERLVPKFTAFRAMLVNEYLPAGRETAGISEVPGGSAWYDHYIRYYTTTDMTADEIFELGLSEVARIRAEMEKVMDEVGFDGSLREFFDFVRDHPDLQPFTDPQQVIDNFNAIHEKIKPNVAALFDKVPEARFEVRRTEAFREASASAQYHQAAKDGSRPGIFYVPVPDVGKYNNFRDESLFLHEAIPGHHYQISLQQENEALPEFRKTLWFSAYGEGWALYAESLGEELGLYTDPFQYFGMLSAEMHRAIRLVVDVGMHTKGWTREQAIEYSLNNEAEPYHEIISEIERYMAAPGQALSYKIGQLKIRELRSKAEAALGEAFSVREFHNQVLSAGSLPLALLEDRIDDWISSVQGSSID
jgi:uncharacterized protein (DUF885 family)